MDKIFQYCVTLVFHVTWVLVTTAWHILGLWME